MAQKTALIFGVTGQDGAYLADFLIKKGYRVHGVKRRSSSFNTSRIDHIFRDPHDSDVNFFLHHGDVTDSTNIIRIIQEVRPDEIYNLAAQSHVHVSFETPEYTANADGLGALRILEAIRILNLSKSTRFYQASTSELYGSTSQRPQTEKTPFHPRSPYGVAKAYAYWITVNYREAYGIHASNGILFNHESPLRGETFVTRKITRAAAKYAVGRGEVLYLGNLDAVRDWGHTKDFVHGMWRILQKERPSDYVLATGKTATVRDFAQMAFKLVGRQLKFSGKGIDEVGCCQQSNEVLIKIDPYYFRPAEVEYLCGDPSKAREELGWVAETSLESLAREMVLADIYRAKMDLDPEFRRINSKSAAEIAMSGGNFGIHVKD
jgi:GDPmannose 4,6-dehydratase